MPLVRVEVRNEYKLGMSELFKQANEENPKALLDGVVVAGLVGILRQLGDLAEFAAEVFHGLQEQVTYTCSRSHKLIVRAQSIEAALPPLEKTILAQRSHLHFAYTTGSQWHARLRNEQNHFLYGDLPCFIMNLYEECYNPPRLHLLDKYDDNGAPGSCLKRYSDPAFFRSASAGFYEVYIGNIRRDKKGHRRKKKRTWCENGEVPHGVSSHQSCRAHYASQKFNGQTPPSWIVSTVDATLKSKPREESPSFTYKAGSGYIECIFSPNYAIKSDRHETEEIPSHFKLHNSDTLDTFSLEEDIIEGNNYWEETDLKSSSVTWDEKAEIREPTGPKHNHDEMAGIILTNFDPNPPDKEAVHLRTKYQIDFNFDSKSMPAAVSSENQLGDTESKTGNYMDARSAIESESEVDVQCQSKREVYCFPTLNDRAVDEKIPRCTAQHTDGHIMQQVEPHVPVSEIDIECHAKPQGAQFSTLNNKVVDGQGMHRQKPQHLNINLADSECHVAVLIPSSRGIFEELRPELYMADNSFFNKTSTAKSDVVGSDNYDHEHSPQAAKSLYLNTFPCIGSSVNADILGSSNAAVLRNCSSDSVETIQQSPKTDTVLSSFWESEKLPSMPSSVIGVNFWTNGDLLGLAPSKPTDLSILNSVKIDSVAKSEERTVLCPSQNICDGDGLAIKSNIIEDCKMAGPNLSSQFSISCHDDQEGRISMMDTSSRLSQAHSNFRLEHSTDFHVSLSPNQSHKHHCCETNKRVPVAEEPANANAQASKCFEHGGRHSSRMFELTNRLHANSIQMNASRVADNNFVSSVKNGVSKQKGMSRGYETFSARTFKEQFGIESPFISPSSSPPLEHMKISFQPIDCFETCKLKLKFPSVSDFHESRGDNFPSFQLVPDISLSLQDGASVSDDDTFCRSSPCISDDCLSLHSASDSEQWEGGEYPRCKDLELSDAFCRMSATEFVSNDLGTGRTVPEVELQNPFIINCSQSGLVLDLPSIDYLSPSIGQELYNDSDSQDHLDSDFSQDPTRSPFPPLAPVEWQSIKPHQDVEIENLDTHSEAIKQPINLKLSSHTVSQQPKPAPVKYDQTTEQPDWQKLHGQEDAHQPLDGKKLVLKEDFLQHIRTKSTSLRRTMLNQTRQ